MQDVFEILKFSIPALLVFAITYFLMNKFFEREKNLKSEENKIQARKEYIPLRIQAYERATLYLERIDLNNLLMRASKPHYTSRMLYQELMKHIRDEYAHNMVQQIYISQRSWNQLKQAKEETVKIVNMAMNSMKDNATGMDLSKVIFDIVSKLEKIPTDTALEKLRADFQKGIM
ncbi:MAG: hypothetical protein ACI8Q1_002926 [Parvicella sp.]|jgi:hypothetical protein